MKTKKTFIPIVTLCAALFLTSCTGKNAATTEKPQDSQTEASTEATGDSSTTLDDLYQQENQKLMTVTAFPENRLSSTVLPS